MNMTQKILFIIAALSFFTFRSYTQIDSLKNKIEQIIKTKDAVVGVSICSIENNESLNINSGKHFPCIVLPGQHASAINKYYLPAKSRIVQGPMNPNVMNLF